MTWLACASCSSRVEPETPDARGRDAALVLRDSGGPDDTTSHDAQELDAPEDAGLAGHRWEDEVVYFVLTDRFVNGDPSNDGDSTCTDPSSPRLFHGGDLEGLRQSLDYVAELGATTIWITPVAAQVGRHGTRCGYHGYWADLDDPDDGAIEPRLGGAPALTALLEAMHARGLRLMADVVVNHAGYDARLTRARPEWLHDSASCASLGDPTVTCPIFNLPDLAQERPEVSRYLVAQTESLLWRFPVDALRVDTVKHVPASFFRDAWLPAVHELRSDGYVVGELFDDTGLAAYDAYYDAGFDGLLDFVLRRALVEGIARRGSLDDVADAIQAPIDRWGIARARLRGTMIDNHDVPRFLSEASPGMPAEEQRERLTMALGVLFTSPGIPHLYYGTELGMLGVNDADDHNRRDLPGWALGTAPWPEAPPDHLAAPARTHAIVRALGALRGAHPALRRGGYAELWRPGGGGTQLLAYVRGEGPSPVVIAIHAGSDPLRGFATTWARNPGVSDADRAALPEGVVLRERLGLASGAAARIEGGRVVFDLPPRSVAVFTAP
ncbi:MAG: hypothetical protein K1X94_15810 [Sandaracinaceae bacterium]|nr:hypothetical protein [Sandaracinaceae bacterium]